MRDRDTWLILAERCATIRRLRLRAEELPRLCAHCAMGFHGRTIAGATDNCDCVCHGERITLAFDSHDQASVLTVEPT